MAKHRDIAPERQMDRALLALRRDAEHAVGANAEAARVLLWEVDRAMIAGNQLEVLRLLRPIVRTLGAQPKKVILRNWYDDFDLEERFGDLQERGRGDRGRGG